MHIRLTHNIYLGNSASIPLKGLKGVCRFFPHITQSSWNRFLKVAHARGYTVTTVISPYVRHELDTHIKG